MGRVVQEVVEEGQGGRRLSVWDHVPGHTDRQKRKVCQTPIEAFFNLVLVSPLAGCCP